SCDPVVNDGQNDSLPAIATINVVSVNDAPVAIEDIYTGIDSVLEGTTVVRGNVLVSDTDVDSPTITVGQVATDESGTGAVVADGSSTIVTALGGIVMMNADGTFTYTAPVRDHSDSIPDIDSFVYRATDGSAMSDWTTVTINIADSVPIANDDLDSVGIGSNISGNVITGAGGNTTGGADSYHDAPTVVSTVTYKGTTYSFDNNDSIIIDADNGKLEIRQDGSYTYTSNYKGVSIPASPGNTAKTVADWNAAGVKLYGFDTVGQQERDLYGDSLNKDSINLASLDSQASDRVTYQNSAGSNNDGLGVEHTGKAADDKLQVGEHLV